MLTMSGLSNLQNKLGAHLKKFEEQVVNTRRQIARFLIEQMLRQTPVWSGDTAGSYSVVNSSGDSSGRKHTHAPYQRGTNSMVLGKQAEKYASAAWSQSLGSVAKASYSLDKQIHVINDSDIWGEVDAGKLPPGRARNPSGISDLAITATRAKFAKVLR